MHQAWLSKYNLITRDEIDSTNLEAKRIVKENRVEDFVIWSKSQSAGRGKDNRKWESGRGNLLLTILLNRKINIKQQPLLSFVTALAVSETLMQLACDSSVNLDIKLKWPNDVLVNNHKIAGILLESFNINGVNPLIIGIGININNSPDNINQLATCLVNEGIDKLDIRHILNILMTNFDKYFDMWKEQSFSTIRDIWLSRAAKLNEEIITNDGRSHIIGIFRNIDDNGNIVIETFDGKINTMLTGDVFFGKNNE